MIGTCKKLESARTGQEDVSSNLCTMGAEVEGEGLCIPRPAPKIQDWPRPPAQALGGCVS
jgi:hypothetical protein